jgi:hypothetical protein
MVKRAVRAVVRKARGWLSEDPPAPANHVPVKPPLSYEDANLLFMELDRQSGHNRPHYLWGAIQSANLAKMLGFARISFVEFGVAGGNGLVVLERIAETVERFFGLKIDVHGFDVGEGLPRARDHRDLPNLWREGSYRMDRRKLEERLKTSHLHIGLVERTVEEFKTSNPSPVAFIAFDLDLYSSTVHAFKLLTGSHEALLPRIHCYFDDIMGKTFSDFTGERLAIAEFNQSSEQRKISIIPGLRHFLQPPHRGSMWPDMMFMAHIFDHPTYSNYDGLVREISLDLKDESLSQPRRSGS